MESPVRINIGLCLLLALVYFECCSSQSNNNVTDNSSIESTTLSSKDRNNTLFHPRNKSWLYQRRNMTVNQNPQITSNSTGNSTETTISYGNKINFRGSVKYFATRPPFKPKNPYLKRNATNSKNEVSEKQEPNKLPSKTKNLYLPDYKSHFRKNETNTSSRPNVIPNTTEMPHINVTESNKLVNRNESGKSLDLTFNIDKYTSSEFHDINNVYSQSISPEVEHFIVPDNVSDYFVSVGSAPYPNRYNQVDNGALTTPQTDLFDQRFKEVSDSIKENLADIEYTNDENEKVSTEKLLTSDSDSINFDKLISEAVNDNNTKIIYKNTKEIILTDSENPMSKHSDYMDANGTKIFYETSMLSTETYDQSSSTIKIIPEEDKSDITTSSSIINEVISSDKIQKKEPNTTKRIEHYKTNETRKELLAIRMRIHSTPRPRIRISLKNKIEANSTSITTEKFPTTKSPQLVKLFPFPRRRTSNLNDTFTTTSSKLDPVYQADISPTRMADHTRSNAENSIPFLRKRGSLKYYEGNTTNSTNVEKDDTEFQFSIPPTATAWALISMKNPPGSKRQNMSQDTTIPREDVTIKAEDDLQKLDKITDTVNSKTSAQEPQQMYNALANFTSKSIINRTSDVAPTKVSVENKHTHEELTSASKFDYAAVTLPNSKNPELNQIKQNKVPETFEDNEYFESITKFPSTVTTPIYESQGSDFSTPDFTSEDFNNPTEEESDDIISTTVSVNNIKNNIPIITTVKSNKLEFSTISSKIDENTTTISDNDFETTYFNEKSLIKSTTSEIETDNKNYYETKTTTEVTTEFLDDVSTVNSHVEAEIESVYKAITTTDASMTVNLPTTGLLDIDAENYKISTTTTPISDTTNFASETTLTTESSTYEIESKNLDDVDLDFPDLSTTEDSNSVYMFTTDMKNISDIQTASTVYYNPNIKVEITSPSSTTLRQLETEQLTFEHTSDITSEQTTVQTIAPTKVTAATTKSHISTTTQIGSEENFDSQEIKKTNSDDEDKFSTPDQNDNLEEWIDSPDVTVDIKQLDSNEIPTSILNKTESTADHDNGNNDFINYSIADGSVLKPNQSRIPTSTSTSGSNIEVIKPNLSELAPDSVEGFAGETTPSYMNSDKFDESMDGSGAIAAITISVIGVVALLLLVGVLMVARGRRRSGGYGQRCTPVSLDSYSLDNVSISGSTRRKARRPSKRSYGNPAYDESGATSHPMQFAALANFALDQDSIMSEFNDIPTITARADEVPPGCESKNRYSNVIPLPETRVMLTPIGADETSDYINANYVRGPKNMKNYYIACQAPLSSTVNDFWRMVWEQNSRVILMLTEFMENGVEKCYEYLPPSEVSDSKRLYGDYQITLKKREIRDKYVISILHVKSMNTKVWREVTHMWYFWPAKGVPDECHSIIAFLIEARSYLKASQVAKEYDEDGQDSMVVQNGANQMNGTAEQDDASNGDDVNNQKSEQRFKNGKTMTSNNNEGTDGRRKGGPLIVHCSPGTGRTGALIACDIGIRDFEMSRTVDIPKTVYRIRRDRANAVQTKDQYIFIYKVLSEYATKLTGGILDSI
ncbi:uncharacterized protein LOC143910989 [Arctopsyche grandis]|uniref:uncharacterized protein LOC143910989 n=1 Tax=Arctopsyche grandis TaxID=121162 RepID=UPI00406D8671